MYYPMNFNFLFRTQDNLWQCSYCGKFIERKDLSRDHVYPKSHGGGSTTVCCLTCNDLKKNMKPIEFAIFFSEANNE